MKYYFSYIYHVGYAINLHSIINSGLIVHSFQSEPSASHNSYTQKRQCSHVLNQLGRPGTLICGTITRTRDNSEHAQCCQIDFRIQGEPEKLTDKLDPAKDFSGKLLMKQVRESPNKTE